MCGVFFEIFRVSASGIEQIHKGDVPETTKRQAQCSNTSLINYCFQLYKCFRMVTIYRYLPLNSKKFSQVKFFQIQQIKWAD